MVSLNSLIPIPPIGPDIIAAFTWNQANRENKLNKYIKYLCVLLNEMVKAMNAAIRFFFL